MIKRTTAALANKPSVVKKHIVLNAKALPFLFVMFYLFVLVDRNM